MMIFPMLTAQDKTLPLFLAGIGRQEDQETIIRPEGFVYHQFFFVTHGKGELVTKSGQVHSLPKGCCWWLQKGTPHRYRSVCAPFTTRWISFDGTAATTLLHYFNAQPIHIFHPKQLAILRQQHQFLLESAASNMAAPQLSALTYHLVTDCFTSATATENSALEELRTWICEHFTSDLSLDDMAQQAHCSKYELCRRFRQEYDITPISFLINLRLQKAKELLVGQKELPIRTISELAGFRDPVYFGRMFRQREGMTPLAFRKTFG